MQNSSQHLLVCTLKYILIFTNFKLLVIVIVIEMLWTKKRLKISKIMLKCGRTLTAAHPIPAKTSWLTLQPLYDVAWCVRNLRLVSVDFKRIIWLSLVYGRRSQTLSSADQIEENCLCRLSSFWRIFVGRWWPWFRIVRTAAAVSV